MTGTLLNMATVIVGGTLGNLLGDRLPKRTQETVMHGLGLMTLLVGAQMGLTTRNVLIVLGSVRLGGILGEAWRIEERLEALGRWLEERLSRPNPVAGKRVDLSWAFITASLVFCVGPTTVLGSIQDGLIGDFRLLAIKSMLDGFAAVALAASLGPGVLLSIFTILFYQGGLSLLAKLVGSGLAAGLTAELLPLVEMTATGGVLLMGIRLVLLELKRIRLANFLPAIVIAPVVAWGLEVVPGLF